MSKRNYLDGQMLIAMPGMGDTRFDHSLVYLCAHSENGAMGLIVNKVTPMMSFGDLVGRIEAVDGADLAKTPEELMTRPVLFGGPVEPSRGFVLHTSDYFTPDSSLPVTDKIALTATVDVLRAMARGDGPASASVALGYSGWAPGQLESEIQRNGWLHCLPDEDLLFGTAHELKYAMALKKIGVDPGMLSGDAGHA